MAVDGYYRDYRNIWCLFACMHALDETYIQRDILLLRDRDSLSDKTDTEKKEPLHVAITATSERRAMIIWDNEPDSSSVPRYNAKIQTNVFINGALIHRQSGVTGPNETHPEIGNL